MANMGRWFQGASDENYGKHFRCIIGRFMSNNLQSRDEVSQDINLGNIYNFLQVLLAKSLENDCQEINWKHNYVLFDAYL